MMKHIAITKADINGAEINSVNSRELHKNLGVKSDYATWIKRIIEKYEFVENEDYLTIVKKEGRQNLTDYILSMDMAKEVCMVSNTSKGRETRKYFISIEKQHNTSLVKSLTDQQQKTQALFQTQEVIGEVITSHDKRIANLELNTRIESWQQKNLLDAKNKTVYKLGGEDKKLTNKLHRSVWKHFKDKFNLPRYDALTQGKYEDAVMWLEDVTLGEVV